MSRTCTHLASRPRLLASLAATVCVTAVAACGSNQPVKLAASASPSVAAKSPTAAPPTQAPPPPTPKPTIVAGATYQAPAIIQVENLNAARPQSGLSSADVVYEYSAEGGISRFSAIYFHQPQGQVGPVRSARLISPVLIRQYGGVLIYSGSSGYVYSRMGTWGTPRFEETSAGADMFRISSRPAPHNLYTDGGRVDDMVRRSARPAVSYTLWNRSLTAAGGAPVSGFTAPVSPSERPSWGWNAGAGGWQRTEPDTGIFIDADNGKPITVPTVVVMQVPANLNKDDIEDGCCTAGWEYFLNGSGPAQVFTNGQGYNVTWTATEFGGPPQFTLAGGAPAPIAPGAVWIEVVPTGNTAATRP
ncbi:MAG TPA: DUF3048 domain-containing protein [Candidatus Dormibacteraeota bacterium]|nr:DUF3048 domain-containing protein [Candidatus Dormibacteraeota bacterium]